MSEAPRPAEIARRGKEIYEREIQPRLHEADKGKYLFVDIFSGGYELDRDQMVAFERAETKYPHGLFFSLRVGYPAAHRLGGHRVKVSVP